MTHTRIDLSSYRLSDGSLQPYAFPGGYTLIYLDRDNNCLCSICANNNDELDPPIVDVMIEYEDNDVYCDNCSENIDHALR